MDDLEIGAVLPAFDELAILPEQEAFVGVEVLLEFLVDLLVLVVGAVDVVVEDALQLGVVVEGLDGLLQEGLVVHVDDANEITEITNELIGSDR